MIAQPTTIKIPLLVVSNSALRARVPRFFATNTVIYTAHSWYTKLNSTTCGFKTTCRHKHSAILHTYMLTRLLYHRRFQTPLRADRFFFKNTKHTYTTHHRGFFVANTFVAWGKGGMGSFAVEFRTLRVPSSISFLSASKDCVVLGGTHGRCSPLPTHETPRRSFRTLDNRWKYRRTAATFNLAFGFRKSVDQRGPWNATLETLATFSSASI